MGRRILYHCATWTLPIAHKGLIRALAPGSGPGLRGMIPACTLRFLHTTLAYAVDTFALLLVHTERVLPRAFLAVLDYSVA